jgi:hypothetical protein
MSTKQRLVTYAMYKSFPEAYIEPLKSQIASEDDVVGTAAITTKNDRIRLLELRVFPGAIAAWTRALGPLTRQQLDASKSDESEERRHELSPWEDLATIFNDRSDSNPFQPQNRLRKYTDGKTNKRDQ